MRSRTALPLRPADGLRSGTLILLAAAKPQQRQTIGCECRESKFSFLRAPVQRSARTCRECCDAVADATRIGRICTRKHLVLASHNLLCQTCSCKGHKKRPANGEGKDNGPLDRHCAARCISCRSHTDHPRTEPDHHV